MKIKVKISKKYFWRHSNRKNNPKKSEWICIK